MPFFTLNRNHSLNAKGHCSNFVKGEKTWVAPELAKEAVMIGAVCLDEEIDLLPPEPEVPVELTQSDREAKLFEAFATLEARSNTSEEYREDYNAQSLPNIKPLAKLCGFTPSSKERNDLFQKYREAKAV